MIRTLKESESKHVLVNNYIGNLSYIYRDRPYIAPITYFYDEAENQIIGYSAEGHKTSAMRKKPLVSVSVADIDSVNSWRSVLAQGTYKELSGSEAKARLHQFSLGVKDLIIKKEHRELDFIREFSSKIYKDDLPVIFIIDIDEITGRMRNYYKADY